MRLLIYFLNVPLCPDCGALWDSGWGTLGQYDSFLQHDHYNVNIILADGLIVTSQWNDINQKIEYRKNYVGVK